MKTLRRLTWLLIGVVATVGVASAAPFQQTAGQFGAEVVAVQTDILVLDGDGRPVAGLTRNDFEIYEDGVKQEIDGLDLIEAGAADGVTNVTRRRFVLIVNRLGARPLVLARAKRALEVFVNEFLAEGDEAMVIEIEYSTTVVQTFTDSKELTIRAIRDITPLNVSTFQHTATRQIYDSLEKLGQLLEALPGRKVVIFLSSEPNLIREGIFYIRRTVNALNQSNTTLYSLDLDLLHRPFLHAVDASGLSGLATGTGGRYFFTQSRFSFVPAVRNIGEENRRYYLLTYTPTNHTHEGNYRQIEIRVKRPGFKVKARPGYFAPVASEVIIADR